MFDHTIFQDNLVFVDFCEQMVAETNPSLLKQAETTEAPRGDLHGYRTIADIMRAFNPFEGEVYKRGLQISRITREMFCLMEGRHVHPSTLYPGGVGTVATPQVFTDYLSRLLRCLDFVKQAVAMNDDVFDFFYDALPGYEEVGRRRILLGCWGSLPEPGHGATIATRTWTSWGRDMFVTPGIVVDGELLTNNLVDINLGMRILLGSSYYDDWENEQTFVTRDPLGNPVDQRHPWNQTTMPAAAEAGPGGRQLQLGHEPAVVRPEHREHLALDTGGGPLGAALGRPRWPVWSTRRTSRPPEAACGSTCRRPRSSRRCSSNGRPRSGPTPRAEPGAHLLRRLRGGHGPALRRGGAGRGALGQHQGVRELRGAGRGHRRRLPRGRAGRALAPSGDPGRQDRQLPPVPTHAVERQPPGHLRHAGALRGRGPGHARSSRRTARTTSRASTSCARSAASTRACRAVSTCTSATARC